MPDCWHSNGEHIHDSVNELMMEWLALDTMNERYDNGNHPPLRFSFCITLVHGKHLRCDQLEFQIFQKAQVVYRKGLEPDPVDKC